MILGKGRSLIFILFVTVFSLAARAEHTDPFRNLDPLRAVEKPLQKFDRELQKGCALINRADERLNVIQAIATEALSPTDHQAGVTVYQDALSLLAAKRPEETVLGILRAFNHIDNLNPGYFALGDGSGLALLGEIATKLPQNSKTQRLMLQINRYLNKGITLAKQHPDVAKAIASGDIPLALTSALSGFQAMAKKDLENHSRNLISKLIAKEERLVPLQKWKEIAETKVAEVGPLLMMIPEPTERDELMKAWMAKMWPEVAEKIQKGMPIPPQFLATIKWMEKNPSTTKFVAPALEWLGLPGTEPTERGRKFLTAIKDGFKYERERLIEHMKEMAPELSELAHDALSLGTLAGPKAALICGGINSALYLAESRYPEAGMAALEMLPAISQLKLTGKAAQMQRMALRFEKGLRYVAHLNNDIENAEELIKSVTEKDAEKFQKNLFATAFTSVLPRLKMPRVVKKAMDVWDSLNKEDSPAQRLVKALDNPGQAIEDAAVCAVTKSNPAQRAVAFLRKATEDAEAPLCKAKSTIEKYQGAMGNYANLAAGVGGRNNLRAMFDNSSELAAIEGTVAQKVDFYTNKFKLSANQKLALNQALSMISERGEYQPRYGDFAIVQKILAGTPSVSPYNPSHTSLEDEGVPAPVDFVGYAPTKWSAQNPVTAKYYQTQWSQWPADKPSPYGQIKPWPKDQPSPWGAPNPTPKQ